MDYEYTATKIQCIASQEDAGQAYVEARYHLEQGLIKRAIGWQRAAYEIHKVMTQDLDHLLGSPRFDVMSTIDPDYAESFER